jgi:hypothetical protein
MVLVLLSILYSFGYRRAELGGPGQLAHDLVYIAPSPTFARFNGTNHRMPGSVKVLGGMFVLGGITAADVSTFQAQPQMNPGVAAQETFTARVLVGAAELNVLQMGALVCHRFS